MASPTVRSMLTAAYAGNGSGPSGPAEAQAEPRPQPPQLRDGAQDGPSAQELRAAWQAYSGNLGDNDASRLAVMPGEPDLNIESNRIKPIVNTGVDFLFGPPLALRVTDVEADTDANAPETVTTVRVSPAAQNAQRLLDAVWGDDDLRMTLLSKMGVNGGVYGHVFVKIVAPRKGPASLDTPPRLVVLNPENVTLFTDPEDVDCVTRFRIEYATTDPATASPIRRRQDIARIDPDGDDDSTADGQDEDTTWLIQNFIATGASGGRFIPVDNGQVWPYAWPPIIDWQNYPNPNGHWGQRDVTDTLVSLNRQLRLVESNINKITFNQGHPQLFSVGANTAGVKRRPGDILDLGEPDADLRAVNAAGDLAQLMGFADQLRADMDEESGIPGVALGRMATLPRGQISGITMRLLYAPAIARTEHKRRLYGQGIRQVCQTVLCLCGVAADTVKNLDFQLGWQDPLPNDDLAMAQTAVTLQQIGYSEHTLIERTGGDPDVEAQWKAEESAAQMSAVTQGKAMPPLPGLPLQPPAAGAPAEDGSESDGGEPPAIGANTSSKPMPPTNHPAAIAARQRMRAAFGKTGQDRKGQ